MSEYGHDKVDQTTFDSLKALMEDWKKLAEDRKEVLIAVLRGEACGDDCATGGHMNCYGCENRIRKVVGLKPKP